MIQNSFQANKENNLTEGKILAIASGTGFLITAVLLPLALGGNPLNYYIKPYLALPSECDVLRSLNSKKRIFLVEQLATELQVTKSCLDTLVYPTEAVQYQILKKNIKAVNQLQPNTMIPFEYRQAVDDNLANINLNQAVYSEQPLWQRWLGFFLGWFSYTLILLLLLAFLLHTGV